jgi:hypothetical protein
MCLIIAERVCFLAADLIEPANIYRQSGRSSDSQNNHSQLHHMQGPHFDPSPYETTNGSLRIRLTCKIVESAAARLRCALGRKRRFSSFPLTLQTTTYKHSTFPVKAGPLWCHPKYQASTCLQSENNNVLVPNPGSRKRRDSSRAAWYAKASGPNFPATRHHSD